MCRLVLTRCLSMPILSFQIVLVVSLNCRNGLFLWRLYTFDYSKGYGGFSPLCKRKFKLHTPLCMTNTSSFVVPQIQFDPCVLAVQDSYLERSLAAAICLLSWLWLEKNNRSKAKRTGTPTVRQHRYVPPRESYRQAKSAV